MFFRRLLSTLSICLLVNKLEARSDVIQWIESDRITNWGDWGGADYCPEGSYVTGFDLKIEGSQGGGDDTALNSIKLVCTSLKGVYQKDIVSSEGVWGDYRGRKYCPNGLGNGFELRSESSQGGRRDDTAAVDFNLICANNDGTSANIRGGEILTFGEWRTTNRMCPPETAICGIRTQVEPPQGGRRDDTALNNVDLACCRVPHPANACELQRGHWETVIGCHQGISQCNVKFKSGLTTSSQTTNTLSESIKLAEKLGFSVSAEASIGILKARLETNGEISKEKFNEKTLQTIISQTDTFEMEWSFQISCVGTAQELVLVCGPFKVKTKEYRCVSD
ncbi:uncharacterized protein LOC119066963 [Bradysia coprophila]|uniref:uncharacterized protein LOC119066963 n=1 Tax=Bradysia coprophila TaxID=38358 RepID=UPI00187DAC72|nr:uncharacterized protein LOC119066963 [Bradysia coprophila]